MSVQEMPAKGTETEAPQTAAHESVLQGVPQTMDLDAVELDENPSQPSSVQALPNQTDQQQEQSTADIQITVPDGVAVDMELFDEFKSFAKERGLKSEEADRLMKLNKKSIEKTLEHGQKQFAETMRSISQKWFDQVAADPEVGGNKLEQSRSDAAMFIRKFGGKPLLDTLKAANMINSPELFKAFARAGRYVQEAGPTGPGAMGGAKQPTLEDVWETRLKSDTPTGPLSSLPGR